MEYVASSVFQSDQRIDEFQFFPIPGQHTIQQDHEVLTLVPSKDADNVVSERSSDYSHRRRKADTASGHVDHGNPNGNDHKKKKIIHRDIERQRRRDMTTLYATLRSLLPFEYLKGKRSVSDHMKEAVNYIVHLQKKILELSDKRDELKKLSDSHASRSVDSTVLVRPCLAGVEVVITTGLRQGLMLSSVLEVMVAEGLSVVTCLSSKLSLIFELCMQVNDGRSIDPSELQNKLTMLKVPSFELNLAVQTM
ncbi:hypothetical protein PTKIN_Ptkin04bG0197100 [Pterospermum kingtungense]